MSSKRDISILGIAICLFFFLLTSTELNAQDTTFQIMTRIDKILEENPMKPGTNVQLIKIAETDAVTLYVVRSIEGYFLKPHVHKTHDESVYVVKGTGQMLIDDKWVDIQPGNVHFNPRGKVHSIKHAGSGELVVISVFTPALKEPDRHFVQ
jgi:mannose-6-phosphate isomerase-like protein (cupin superfamily)